MSVQSGVSRTLAAAGVDRKRAGAIGGEHQEATGHREVLLEMDQLRSCRPSPVWAINAVATENAAITQPAMRVWKPTRIARPPRARRGRTTTAQRLAGQIVHAEIGGRAGNVRQLAEAGEDEDDRQEDAADRGR